MKLNFTGIGSAFNFTDGSCSAYFIHESTLNIIDSGETTYISLLEEINFEAYQHVNYFITHLHNDHIGSLGTTISDLYLNHKIRVNIFHPQSTVVDLLRLMGVEDKMYNFVCINEYKGKDISVIFIKTQHVPNMNCYGLLITVDDEVNYYSGDSNMIPNNILKLFNEDKINKIYQDTCILIESSGSHLHYKELLKLIPENKLNRIYCMHLEPDSLQQLKNKGFSIAGE